MASLRYRGVRSQALVLGFVLVLEAIGHFAVAKSAAGSADIRYFMIATKRHGESTVCIGDKVDIHVRVVRANQQGTDVQAVPGAAIRASLSNPNVGSLSPMLLNTGLQSDDPGGADYIFTAQQAGRTVITYRGTISHIWNGLRFLGLRGFVDRRDFVEARVEIAVEKCEYSVTAISRWRVPGPANIVLQATMDGALVDDGAEGRLSGRGSVTWNVITSRVGDCRPQVTTSSGPVELTAERDPGGLIIDITYPATAVALPTFCVGSDGGVAQGAMPVVVAPDPITVDFAGRVVAQRLKHTLRQPETRDGTVVIVVERRSQ